MNGTLLVGDALEHLRQLPAESVHCCVTSPPYWGLRDYGVEGQLGLEPTPEEYVARMVEVFGEVRRVLRDDGTLWLNVGDSYSSGGREGHGTRVGYKQQSNRGINGTADPARPPQPPGLKPKDLVGIPWRLALTEPRRRVLTYLCRGQRCLTDAQVPCSELVWDCQTTFALVNAMQRDGLLRLDDDAHTDEWCDVYASATEAGVEALGADALEADGR